MVAAYNTKIALGMIHCSHCVTQCVKSNENINVYKQTTVFIIERDPFA